VTQTLPAGLPEAAHAQGLRYFVRHGLKSLSNPGHRLFVDCPTHGPGRPYALVRSGARFVHGVAYPAEIYDMPVALRPGVSEASPDHALCSKCLAFVPTRDIAIRGSGRPTTSCGGACLAGKRSCDCRCRGLCHGAGSCVCGG